MTNRKADPQELATDPAPAPGQAYINANGLVVLADGSTFCRIVLYTPANANGQLAARMVDWLNADHKPAPKPSLPDVDPYAWVDGLDLGEIAATARRRSK